MNENAVIGLLSDFETVLKRIYVSKQIFFITLDNESAVHYSSGVSDNFLLAPA
jgi:hypothetical protein